MQTDIKMNNTHNHSYDAKIGRVCDYISTHLNDDLSVAKLSLVANFSKFHFHRQFSVYTGVTVAKFILMMRLKRASYQLVFEPDMRIIDIALDANFENPESFSRAFKKTLGQSPSQFRNAPKWQHWNELFVNNKLHSGHPFTIESTDNMHVEITHFNEQMVAVLEHAGAPELVNHSVQTFIEWRKSCSLSPVDTSKSYGIVYDDPKNTKPEDFRFDICGSVTKPVPANPQGVIEKVIPGGRCARIRHLGSHDAMDEKIYYLYGQWLPESGEELRDSPFFFHYINLFPQVAEHELITDIYLPLK